MNRHGYDGRHPDICGVPDPQGDEHAPFTTMDGVTHKTWNAARKHLTGLGLLRTIQGSGPDPVSIRDAVMREWRVSRRIGGAERRAEAASSDGRALTTNPAAVSQRADSETNLAVSSVRPTQGRQEKG